jgi:hypothetical protein
MSGAGDTRDGRRNDEAFEDCPRPAKALVMDAHVSAVWDHPEMAGVHVLRVAGLLKANSHRPPTPPGAMQQGS